MKGTIENNIRIIADGIERDPYLTDTQIIQAYIDAGFEMADITLLLAGGKLLASDRKNGRLTSGVFRRAT